MKALSRYIVSEDVQLEDVSDREALISVEGPRASELLSKLAGEPLPELPPYHFTHTSIGETPIRVGAARHGPGPGFDVAIAVDRAVPVLEKILDAGNDVGLRIAGHSTQNTRRIEAGIPLFGVDMNESHLLLEVDLKNAVSFNKGCYLGQEYVARLAHQGHLNKKLVGLKIGSAYIPLQGDEILGEGQPVGQVTSATFSPALDYPIALGYVHRRFFERGTTVFVKSENEQISARVAKLPFIDWS
jgi:aminomethyltransferase